MKAAVSRQRSAAGIVILTLLVIAASASAGQPIVVILANYLTLDDLVSAGPNVRSLINDGAVGLMNTGYRIKSPDAPYLILGTGIQAGRVNGMAECYKTDELVGGIPAGEVYHAQTGKTPPKGSVVCLGFARILRANQKPPFRADAIGLLGDSFHEAHLRTAVIAANPNMAAFVAMGRNGLVDSTASDADLIVIEPPDFNKLENMRELLSKRAYDLEKTRCLRNLDDLIARIRHTGATMIVCSPCPVQADKGFKPDLAPIVLFQPHGKKGLLTSGTTRTDGLITNMDVAPTILSQASLPVPGFVIGRPASVITSSNPIGRLRRMEQVVTQEYKIRIPTLAAIGVLAILSGTILETSLVRRKGVRTAMIPILLFLLSLPAALLITDGFRIIGVVRYVLGLILITAAIATLSYAVSRLTGRRVSPLPIVQGMTALLILGDVFTGSRLLQWSIVTCNQICGIRYYGLGNEYMGLLVASALLFPLLLWKSKRMTIPVLIWFAGVALVIGYPGFGANAGGFLTAVGTFGIAWIVLSGVRFRTRHAFALILLALLGIGVFFSLDIGSRASHFGRSMALARIYGWQWLGYFIGGKLLMHLGILKTPQVQYTILASIPFFVLHGRRMKSEIVKRSLVESVGFPAIIGGMIVAFLFNDSGIVPAGLMISVYMVSILYLRVQEAK